MRRRYAEGWTRSRGGHRGALCRLAGFLFARFVLLYGIRDNAGTNLLRDHKSIVTTFQAFYRKKP